MKKIYFVFVLLLAANLVRGQNRITQSVYVLAEATVLGLKYLFSMD